MWPARGVIITQSMATTPAVCRAVEMLARPFFCPGRNADAYIRERQGVSSDEPRRRAEALRDRTEEISSSHDFRIGEIDFHPFTIPHDAVDNFGFTATHDGIKIATLMDFGHVTTLVNEQLRDCAAIVIESNHSRDMLKACAVYPWELKQRILSRTGHLSNEDVAVWLREGFDGSAAHIVLAHLSQRANNPYVAKLSAEVALQERGSLFQRPPRSRSHFPKSRALDRARTPALPQRVPKPREAPRPAWRRFSRGAIAPSAAARRRSRLTTPRSTSRPPRRR